jgi:two-component system phosphate regulon sensor histidine kinase PhoR
MREWLLFGAAALLPVIGLAALGVRALQNEEAAIRREASLAVSAAAQRAVGAANEDLLLASERLRHAAFDDDPSRPPAPRAWYDAARAFAPASGTPVVVSPTGAVSEPEDGARARDEHPDPICDAAEARLTQRDDRARIDAKRELVAKCPEARTTLDRWLWPTLAIESLHQTPDIDLENRLATWLAAHASAMRASERAATLTELGTLSRLDPATEREMRRALEGAASRVESITRALRSDSGEKAIRGARGEVVGFRGQGSLGSLRPLSGGYLVGFVVTPETLDSAIAAGGFAVGPDLRLAVTTESDAARRSPRATTESLEATEWLTDGLGIRVTLAHPEALAARTSRSEKLLAAIAVVGGLVATGLASVLFARMRSARRTSELRTSFVSAVSHELRTPIASIRMLAELLEEGRVEEDERAEVHEALAKEARRLGETVDRLLGFSRMSADKVVTELHQLRVCVPVERAVARFRERNPGVAVEEALDESLEAAIDASQIELVIDNLLGNAKKYAPTGEPYRVRLERRADEVRISVADRGPGIAPRDQRRIFEPFERVDDRLSKATEGSGIGLSLVSHAARAHGGRAWVESAEGAGSTFFVSIPVTTRREASESDDLESDDLESDDHPSAGDTTSKGAT